MLLRRRIETERPRGRKRAPERRPGAVVSETRLPLREPSGSFQAPLEVGSEEPVGKGRASSRTRERVDDLAERAGRDGGGLEPANHADARDEETVLLPAGGAGIQMVLDDPGEGGRKETVVIVIEAAPEPIAVRSGHDWSP